MISQPRTPNFWGLILLVQIFVTALLSGGCTDSKKIHSIQGRTMGTTYSVKFVASSALDVPEIQSKLENSLIEVNRQMSTYIPSSEISQFNQSEAETSMEVSFWFAHVTAASLVWAKRSHGAFDPTIGPLVNLWGFGPQGVKKVPTKEQIELTKARVGYEKLSLHKGIRVGNSVEERRLEDLSGGFLSHLLKDSEGEKYFLKKKVKGVYLDLSASAKGFGVDVLSEKLTSFGFSDHLVEIGGELRARGKKINGPWRVGIEQPGQGQRLSQKIIALEDSSIATSGNYRNFFESGGKAYSHTLNRETGQPVEHSLVSVSILHQNCLTADVLATTLMSLGPVRAKKFTQKWGLASMLILSKKESNSVDLWMSEEFRLRIGEK